MAKIGIMGGTFNPIHYGHLLLAEFAKEEMKLDEVWIIPTGCSYMKEQQGVVSGQERIQMVNLAIEETSEHMKCLDVEVKRGGYTYTFETIELLKEMYPQNEFYFIFGADCLFTIETWKYPERIFEHCKVIAAARNGSSVDEMFQKIHELKNKFGADISLLRFPNIEISSTMIRNRIKAGKSVEFMLPKKVIDYISQKGFYLNENNE